MQGNKLIKMHDGELGCADLDNHDAFSLYWLPKSESVKAKKRLFDLNARTDQLSK